MQNGGGLGLLVREGDLIDVDDGPGVDLRTVTSLSIPNNEVGAAVGQLNRVVFQATFTDGSSGVFVANIIPEPTGLAFLGGLGALMLRRRIPKITPG